MGSGFALVWIGLAVVLGGVGGAVLAPLARPLPDRGVSLGLPAALVIVWLGARPIGTRSITLGLLAGLTLVFGLGTLARRGGSVGRSPVALGVFAVAFGAAVLAQSHTGLDPTQTAALADYGTLRSLLRSATLPPAAIWAAGESAAAPGTVVASLIARITLTPAAFAAPLWTALSYAALLTAAYGLGSALDRTGHRRVASGIATAAVLGLAGPVPIDRALDLVGVAVPTGAATPAAWLFGPFDGATLATLTLVLAVGLLAATYRWPPGQRRERWLTLVAVGPVAGVATTVDPWVGPTILALAGLTVALAPTPPIALEDRPAWLSEPSRWVIAAVVTVGIGAVGVAVAWPDRERLRTAFELTRGAGPTIDTTLLAVGLLAVVLTVTLWAFLRARWDRPIAVVLVASVLVWLIAVHDRPVAALAGGLAVLAVGLARTDALDDRPAPGFAAVLIAVGALAVLARAVVSDPAASASFTRQAWTLFAIATGPALVRLGTHHLPSPAGRSWPAGQRALRAIAVAVVLAGTLTTPLLAAQDHAGTDRDLSVTAGLDLTPSERSALEWLNRRSGSPTIATAPRSGRAALPAAISGLPTVAGPPTPARSERRVSAVETIYTGPATAQRDALATYDVRYVYAGPAERAAYGRLTLDDRSSLDPITASEDWPTVTIYRVETD
ncbi:DUF2298 domain-containing protein [Halococcoides cellulosivorans]|uniref:Uncharacterized protein n=1 Tax=Halococcoides cellulosivorans TaxID=1679096 RepID=A0A2R4WZZ6_9EURY|nr:DUF2298 domain-containing protein [Halococcoides cellulosivorans]AWB27126.1 hypothetical protein HARCEL1_05090 [Halococcoides cellulosivorans]